nr:MAG TPA: hypothetical protein [Crassvirales sp.]
MVIVHSKNNYVLPHLLFFQCENNGLVGRGLLINFTIY